MAYQLVYTSYPISLKSGRSGFSTVARSKSMPERLADAVERRSSYDISYGEKFSHSILEFAGEKWHILTRTRDSGADYTNRNNYISHHLVISTSEIALLANPAEILLGWNGWLDTWNTEPCFLDDVKDLEKIPPQCTLPAQNWATLFGDAGAAATLGNTPIRIAVETKDARVLLKLYSESLLLNVNPIDAWNITFTTSLSASDNPADFIWRAMPKITADIQGGATIDLIQRKHPTIPQERSAEYARSGLMNNRERLNLKVGAPIKTRRNFNVVDTVKPAQNGISTKILIGASILVSLIAVALIFTLFSSEESASQTPELLPQAQEMKTIAPLEQSSPQLELSQRRGLINLKIDNCEFLEALNLWDNSVHAKNDPSYRLKILSAIGKKADALIASAERMLALKKASSNDVSNAKDNLKKAQTALSVSGVPRTEERLEMLNNLKKKF